MAAPVPARRPIIPAWSRCEERNDELRDIRADLTDRVRVVAGASANAQRSGGFEGVVAEVHQRVPPGGVTRRWLEVHAALGGHRLDDLAHHLDVVGGQVGTPL